MNSIKKHKTLKLGFLAIFIAMFFVQNVGPGLAITSYDILNPSFEDNTSAWAYNGAYRSTGHPHTGSYSAVFDDNADLVEQSVSTPVDDMYTFTFWVKGDSYEPNAIAIILVYNTPVGYIVKSFNVYTFWTKYTIYPSAFPLSGAIIDNVQITSSTIGSSVIVYVDDVQLTYDGGSGGGGCKIAC